MRDSRTTDPALIVAAQAGDRRALDEIVRVHLPLVYNIVRRALGGHPDVDDVVQDVMLRALRQLPALRAPESFRPWLAAIAVRQVSTHLDRDHLAAARVAALDEAADLPDAGAASEDLTLLRVELSDQRRRTVRASRWLDPDDQALLSLWWLETAGELTRSELAAALGVSVAHAGVRVQRMRDQLDLSRSVVAALDVRPGCAELPAVVVDWDGVPGPLWRKRIARHTRSCPVCARAADDLVAPEALLGGYALFPVPVALAAALLHKSAAATAAVGTTSTAALSAAGSAGASGGAAAGASGAAVAGVSGGAAAGASGGAVAGVSGGAAAGASGGAVVAGKAGLFGQLALAVGAHPVAAAVTAGALVVGATVGATAWPTPSPSAPAVIAAPTAGPAPESPAASSPASSARPTDTGTLTTGPVSLESGNATGRFVGTAGFEGVLVSVGPAGDPGRERATFDVVPGRADANCFSFRTRDGWYLRHSSWRVRLSLDQGTERFRADATFCARTDPTDGSVSLESWVYPGWFLRHRGDELWVDRSDGSTTFQADGSFLIRPPLA